MLVNQKLMDANNTLTRYTIHQGGTGSGKTYSILQYLGKYALDQKGTLTVTIAAESVPHLKRGALRDFRSITYDNKWPFKEHKTDHTFIHKNITIEFVSASEPDKMRGSRRDILYINECNRVPYASFRQMDMRTRRRTFLDFNPTRRFWVHNELMPTLTQPEFTFTKSTYLDNNFLDEPERRSIERNKGDAGWWTVYGLGEIGGNEGLILSNWEILTADELKIENGELKISEHSPLSTLHSQLPGKFIGYGIDFGFVNSYTAVVAVSECNGELYADELFYKTNAQNEELLQFAKQNMDLTQLAVADSNEAKTIDFLHDNGWSGIKKCEKGNGSVSFGLQLLTGRKINVTPRSKNLIRELENYMWDTNHDGDYTNRPIKKYDHAIDALRYLITYPEKKRIRIA